MKYGLQEKQLQQIVDFIAKYPEVEEAVLFGSRAIGTFKEASDVDIALKGGKVTASLAAKLKFDIEEDTYLPFFFDFVAYEAISNEALREHIDQKGIVVYRRGDGDMSGWREVFVEEIASPGKNALSTGPFGSSISAKFFVEEGIPVIRGGNLSFEITRQLNDDGFVFVSTEKAEEFNRSIVVAGDLVFTCWGTVNQVGLIGDKSKYTKYVISNKQMKLTPDSQKADSLFLYYLFSGPEKQQEILNNAIGAAVPGFNLGQLKKMILSLPLLPEQKAIAAVLSSLDDKIDLLHRQNATLEAMAETLFRQWFVVEARGDWEEVCLSDICSVITKGTTPTTLGHQFVETGVNFIKAESITDDGSFIIEKFAKISDETHRYLKRSIVESGDVLCSIAGTIGRIAIVDDSILPANTNQAIAILRVISNKCFPEFVYLFLKSASFREIMDGKIIHAVQPNLSLGEIGNTVLQYPPFDLLHEFEGTIRPIFEKKRRSSLQIRTLEKLRDTLLPKLMSGEVRVKL